MMEGGCIYIVVSGMVRKQIYLASAQCSRLRELADRQRRTEAEILREVLDRHFNAGKKRGRKARARDSLWDILGVCDGPGSVSDHVDDILYGGGGA